jgi:hypothetical protein
MRNPSSDHSSPVVPVDDLFHTDDHPFCPLDSCTCHQDPALLASVEHAVTDGLFTLNEATNFVQGKTM